MSLCGNNNVLATDDSLKAWSLHPTQLARALWSDHSAGQFSWVGWLRRGDV